MRLFTRRFIRRFIFFQVQIWVTRRLNKGINALVLPDVDHLYEALFAKICDRISDAALVQAALLDDRGRSARALFENIEDGTLDQSKPRAFLDGSGFLDLGRAVIEGFFADEIKGSVCEVAPAIAV
jgi:hypothetical protein